VRRGSIIGQGTEAPGRKTFRIGTRALLHSFWYEKAEKAFSEVADMESATEKHPVTPGPVAKAGNAYGRLMALCNNADSERSELLQAKAFLGKR
jgi:hypothetical protein